MIIQRAILDLELSLRASEIHKLRGCVGNLFRKYDIIHNHNEETGSSIYRYPLIQFKNIDKKTKIIAFSEDAVKIFSEIFLSMDEIDIEGRIIRINEKHLKVDNVEFNYSEEKYVYEFLSPWIGLNQRNYDKYMVYSEEDKKELLNRCLTGNILSMAKYLNYRIDRNNGEIIMMDSSLEERIIKLKGKSMLGFTGIFKTNFLIPDFSGLGKSVSRGFGTIRRMI